MLGWRINRAMAPSRVGGTEPGQPGGGALPPEGLRGSGGGSLWPLPGAAVHRSSRSADGGPRRHSPQVPQRGALAALRPHPPPLPLCRWKMRGTVGHTGGQAAPGRGGGGLLTGMMENRMKRQVSSRANST